VALDRFPKKPCKHCGLMGHWSYDCRLNPKKVLKRTAIKPSTKAIKRSPINKMGKHAKQWFITRATWIRRNPPPIRNQYWECYLQIHEWCPRLVDVHTLTLDHVISRTRDPSLRYTQSNLRPACGYCNDLKGSRSLDEVKPGAV
jgi:5-methylcytosine-specific restriction endonuclease McrA